MSKSMSDRAEIHNQSIYIYILRYRYDVVTQLLRYSEQLRAARL